MIGKWNLSVTINSEPNLLQLNILTNTKNVVDSYNLSLYTIISHSELRRYTIHVKSYDFESLLGYKL